MRTAIFDLETDGLLDGVTKVHLFMIKDVETLEVFLFREWQWEEALAKLDEYDIIIGHNSTRYDLPVLEKLYGYTRPWQTHRDTMVIARLIWSNVLDADIKLKAKGKLPGHLMNSHALEAWGYRLGQHKGEYEGDPAITDEKERRKTKWLKWNQAMQDYGVQDLVVTLELWTRIVAKAYSEVAILLETQVAHICARQERFGFLFDEQAAAKLYSTLIQKRSEIEQQMQAVFPPRFLRDGPAFTPSRDLKVSKKVKLEQPYKGDYCAGAPFQKIKQVIFNPGSRAHVALWLGKMRGWKPTEFTSDGGVKVDETILAALPYPEAVPLVEYYTIAKRIGQVAEGDQAWLRKVQKDKRMHGSVNTNGTVTGRMSHASPNMGQVPASYSPYGHECRSCFTVPLDKELVGADADALELRLLAGYMAHYDKGAYIKTVLEGVKSDGTDMHSVNCRAIGMDPKALYHGNETGRDVAKTWFYAFLYGAGDAKLGHVLTRLSMTKPSKDKPAPSLAAGTKSRASFVANLPALGKLAKAVQKVGRERGHLIGLDGRHIHVRSTHAALNTLLQGGGGIVMKRALCLLDDSLQSNGLTPGKDYEFVANVHDEWQIECTKECYELVGNSAVSAIRSAGESFSFACPLDGEWKHGRTWADTH